MRLLNSYCEPGFKRDLPLAVLILRTLHHHYQHDEVFDDQDFILRCADELVRLVLSDNPKNARTAIELSMAFIGVAEPVRVRKRKS